MKILNLEKPKASCSAFVFFGKYQRKKLQEEFPNDTFQDISAKLGKLWNNLPEEEREYYEELSLIDKCRFKEEKRVYRQQLYSKLLKALHDGTIQPNQIDKSILMAKKQPKPPFMFYARHVKPMLKMHTDPSKTQLLSKPLSLMWNSLNTQQRIPFNNMSRENVEQLKEEHIQEQEILSMIDS